MHETIDAIKERTIKHLQSRNTGQWSTFFSKKDGQYMSQIGFLVRQSITSF